LLFLFNNVSLTTICHISPLCHSFIAALQLGSLTATTAHMLEQTCVPYNEVCNFYHSSRSWKYRDFLVKTKTKTKTIFYDICLKRPRPRSRDYIPGYVQGHVTSIIFGK